MIAALSGVAWALPVTQPIRVYHETNFVDASLTNGDDFFRTNTTYLARWAFVEVYDTTTNTSWGDYTDDDGLVTFHLDSTHTYELILHAVHDYQLTGRILIVEDAYGVPKTATSVAFSPTWVPPLQTPQTLEFVFDAAMAGQYWVNAAAVGSWMIRRRPEAWPIYNTDNEAVYRVKMVAPSDPNLAAGYDPNDQTVYLDPLNPDAINRKYSIAHELGHALAHWAIYDVVLELGLDPLDDGPATFRANLDFEATDDSECLGGDYHDYVSKEFQSAAIHEGLAHYAAVVAFNNTTQTDCRYVPKHPIEWNPSILLGDIGAFSCQGAEDGDAGGAESNAIYPVSAWDFFQYCTPDPGAAIDNRGVEVDWLRFFFDLDHFEGVPFRKIVESYAESQPFTWNANDTGVSADDPRPKLEAAFGDNTYGDEWDNQLHNGIWR